jgi:hypothetical protein
MTGWIKSHVMPTLTLFTSLSTLVCCALPALFVTLGAGATLAGFVSSVPQLMWFSENKIPLFIFSAIMLTIGGILQYRARFEPCPVDPVLAQACTRNRRISLWVYGLSLLLFLVGLFFAFLAERILL